MSLLKDARLSRIQSRYCFRKRIGFSLLRYLHFSVEKRLKRTLYPIFFLRLHIFLGFLFFLLILSVSLFSYYWHYFFKYYKCIYFSCTFLEAYNTCYLQKLCTYCFFFYSNCFMIFFFSFSLLYNLSWLFCFYSKCSFRNY
jgi:hypothetical protein